MPEEKEKPKNTAEKVLDLNGLVLDRNYIRPHEALKSDTPADRAGIRVEGEEQVAHNHPERGASTEGVLTVLGFQSQAMREYITKNTSPSVESAPTSQSLAERTYSRIGTMAKVMRPTAANQLRTLVLNSLMTFGQTATSFKHLHAVNREESSNA